MKHAHTTESNIVLLTAVAGLLALTGPRVSAEPTPSADASPKKSEVPAAWERPITTEITVVVEKQEIVVWEGKAEGNPARTVKLPREDLDVRQVIRAPWRGGILILADDLEGFDWSSTIFFFDPREGVLHTVFDSDKDVWSKAKLLRKAVEASGRQPEAMIDNDIKTLYEAKAGGLYFGTEDRIYFRMNLEEGVVQRLDACYEAPKPVHKLLKKETIEGHEGFVVLWPGGVELPSEK